MDDLRPTSKCVSIFGNTQSPRSRHSGVLAMTYPNTTINIFIFLFGFAPYHIYFKLTSLCAGGIRLPQKCPAERFGGRKFYSSGFAFLARR